MSMITAQVMGIDDATLSSAVGTIAQCSDVTEAVQTTTVRRNQTREVQLDCPIGQWCTAG
jgi:hypothetical protein